MITYYKRTLQDKKIAKVDSFSAGTWINVINPTTAEMEFLSTKYKLDKQNLIRSLDWTGQSLFDGAAARVKACAADGNSPSLTDLFDATVDQRRLIEAFGTLRVPRHLFKFMYRLMTAHCNAHSDEQPVWQISSGTFESVLALYQRDQDAFDRGVGAG